MSLHQHQLCDDGSCHYQLYFDRESKRSGKWNRHLLHRHRVLISGIGLWHHVGSSQSNPCLTGVQLDESCPLKIVYFSGTPSNGLLTIHPTSDGSATGTTVFTNIFHATATPWVASGGALSVTPVVTGQSIASDFRTITFQSVNAGGLALSTAASATPCTVIVYGAP